MAACGILHRPANPRSPGSMSRSTRAPWQQPFLDRLDLQRQIFRVDAALREAAGDEVESRLRRAHIHVAQLLAVAKSRDRAEAVRDVLAEQLLHQIFLAS